MSPAGSRRCLLPYAHKQHRTVTLTRLVTCLAASLALCAQAPAQLETLPEVRGLELSLTGPSGLVAIGCAATVKVLMENKSDVTYLVGETQTEFAFALSLYDSDGKAVPSTPGGKFIWGHAHSVFGPNAFPPGAKIGLQEELSKLFAVTKPEVYLLTGYNRLVEGFQAVRARPIKLVFVARVCGNFTANDTI